MHKQIIKTIIDLGLIVCFVLLFATKTTGVFYHQIIGLLMLALVIVHLVLNWKQPIALLTRRIKNAQKKKRAQIAIALTLGIALFAFTTITAVDYIPRLINDSSVTHSRDKSQTDKNKTGGTYENHAPKNGESK